MPIAISSLHRWAFSGRRYSNDSKPSHNYECELKLLTCDAKQASRKCMENAVIDSIAESAIIFMSYLLWEQHRSSCHISRRSSVFWPRLFSTAVSIGAQQDRGNAGPPVSVKHQIHVPATLGIRTRTSWMFPRQVRSYSTLGEVQIVCSKLISDFRAFSSTVPYLILWKCLVITLQNFFMAPQLTSCTDESCSIYSCQIH